MKLFYSLIIPVTISVNSFGQDLTKTETANAIKQLSFLAGNWNGSGWFESPQGKDSLTISQTVEIKDSGISFQMDMTSELLSTNMVINTVIKVWYDAKNKNYSTTATSFGRTSNGTASVINDHTLECRYLLNNGTEFKYTYSAVNNAETITGETTSDKGTTWTQIFAGNLSR